MTENEKIELKFILKSLLISTPRAITVDELFSDYAKQEGHVFPFRKFGFSCFIDFLLSIPDTVNVCTYGPRYVTPVINGKVKHINDLVLKQKISSKTNVNNLKKFQGKKQFWHTATYPVPWTEKSHSSNWTPKTSRATTQPWFKSDPVNEYHQMDMQSWDSQAPVPLTEKSHSSNWTPKTSRAANVTPSWFKSEPVNEYHQMDMQSWDSQAPVPLTEKSHSSNCTPKTSRAANVTPSWFKSEPVNEYHQMDMQSWDSQAPVPLTEESHSSNCTPKTSRAANVTPSWFKSEPVNEYHQMDMQSWDSQAPVPLTEKSHISNCTPKTSRVANVTPSWFKSEPVNEYHQMDMQPWDSQAPNNSLKEHKYSVEGPAIPLKSDQYSSNIQEQQSQLDSEECTSFQNKRNLHHDLIISTHSKTMLEKCDGTFCSVKGDTLENCSSSSGVSSGSSTPCRMFSERALQNMRILIKQNPQGIWCSEFPDVYKEYFGVTLEYRLYGYVSMIAVASAYPDIFHCVRRNSSDFLLFDAQQPLPECYTRNLNFDSYCPVITSLFRNNLQSLLLNFPYGLKSSKLWETYHEYFNQDITAHNFGFPNTEHLLQKLQDEEAIHLRQVGEDIMIYPHTSNLTKDEPALPDSPLSHFNIMTQEEATLLASLYPYETVDWTRTIPQQKWLVEQTHVPVLVSDVCSPSKFFLILEGSQYYSALDSLMAKLQEFYLIEGDKYIMPNLTIREGQFCVCPYNDEWHRARICKTWPGKRKVEVFYIDFGTVGEIEIDLLRFMHYDFAKLPIQAIRASLANLKPFKAKHWNVEDTKLFLDLVSGKTLIAELEKIKENGTVSVALVDTTGDDDIHINDMLVAEGYAEFERVFFPSVTGNNLMDQDYSLDSEPQIVTCSRNSPSAPCKGAGRGKIYLDSCLKGIDYSGVQSVNKNVFPETFASICKSVNKMDRNDNSSLESNTWKNTSFENSSMHLRGDGIQLKTNKVDVSYSSNCTYISNTPTHTSITEATAFPSSINKETSTLPFKSIWCNPMPPVTNSTENLSTTLPVFSSTNETMPIPEVQIPPNANANPNDHSEQQRQNWNQINPDLSSSWTNSLSNACSQLPIDLTNTQNLLTSSVPPGLGWNGMSYMNSNPLHAMPPQVIETFNKVILQQRQQQAFLQSILTGLLKIGPSILNKSKESIFSPNPNISFPSDEPSLNISEVLATPSPSPPKENIAYPQSTVENYSNPVSLDYGAIKYFDYQSEERERMVSEIDSINSDKNVYDKGQMTYTENDMSMPLMRESYTENIISNQLTDLSENFSLRMSLKDQSTYPCFKNKREVIANEGIVSTVNDITADEGTTLKIEQEIVYHDHNQDHSKSTNDSSNKATVKPIRLIKKILIGEKFLNLINHYNEPYFCADEIICTFTKLSGTQVALKILGQKNKSIKFVQACRDENIDLFKVLDGCDLNASCRKPNGKVQDILHFISLEMTLNLLKILKVSNEAVLAEIEEEMRSFNPNDEYWCLNLQVQ